MIIEDYIRFWWYASPLHCPRLHWVHYSIWHFPIMQRNTDSSLLVTKCRDCCLQECGGQRDCGKKAPLNVTGGFMAWKWIEVPQKRHRNWKMKMKNEKWKMKNEKWKMKNEKWKMKNEKWKMKNEKFISYCPTLLPYKSVICWIPSPVTGKPLIVRMYCCGNCWHHSFNKQIERLQYTHSSQHSSITQHTDENDGEINLQSVARNYTER